MNIHKVEFIKSAAAPQGLINDDLPQIVFAGRSNVGKSSVINSLLARKNFARVGASPGKTIHINYFLVDSTVYFIDLPGYGYAKASGTERSRWAKLMDAYFANAGRVALGVLIVDARHKPTAGDVVMSDLFKSAQCKLIVTANKVDKVKNSEKEASLTLIQETLSLPDKSQMIPYSARTGENRGMLLAEIVNAVSRVANS